MTSSAEPIRAGLIGYGLAGRIFHAPLLRAAGMDLCAVVTSRAEEVSRDQQGVEVLSDPARLIRRSDVDLVVVATPNDSHHPLARAALEAGKHVVVDKPFTISSAEADDLIALARERACLLSVFQNRRWDSDFLTLKSCIERGELGEITSYGARYDRFRPTVRDRWREGSGAGAGLLYDLGAHLIDQALQLLGWPDWLMADIGAQREGGRSDDWFQILMGKGALRILLGAGSIVADPGPRLVVHGGRGSFIKSGLDVQEDQLRAGARPGDPVFGIEPEGQHAQVTTTVDGQAFSSRREPSLPGCHVEFYLRLRAAIEHGAELPVQAEEARDVIRIIELARRSHAEGRRLDLAGVAAGTTGKGGS